MIYYNKIYIIKCNMSDLNDNQSSGYNASNLNYLSELSYSQIMEFYITRNNRTRIK